MENKRKKAKYTNHLIGESSPYLLMHAHNPVDWYPWDQKAFDKAKKEHKLVVISIGYAACHWCHVMEEQSFSDTDVARIMNDHFVAIKVDREERPDIDQIYMDAAQLLTGRGGWPLNVITLADGRPVLAGTYFPKESWILLLNQIQTIFKTEPEKLVIQAEALIKGIKSSQIVHLSNEEVDFNIEHLNSIFKNLKDHIDFQMGGFNGAPKFPLPVGFQFLLYYHYLTKDKKALDVVKITLRNMAFGGIYDQIGGGFARYSTDIYWKVPHFEKMLYDNAQLVSLYSAAYQLTKNSLYKEVVYETLDFIESELTLPALPSGEIGFYSSLDADSEREEGKFYVWTRGEIEKILGKGSDLIVNYYNITVPGNWENGKNILFRKKTVKDFTKANRLSPEEFKKRVVQARQRLMAERSKRIKPALDDKILTAWNALMLIGYIDAYRAFTENRFLQKALNNGKFIIEKMMSADGRLYRKYKNGRSSINGFMDDYALTIKAFISLYQATFIEKWLVLAERLLKYAIKHFYNEKIGMFYYTSDLDLKLIARKMEITDGVIPSSNSVMAMNLYLLGVYFHNDGYIKKSKRMLNNVMSSFIKHPTFFANWNILMGYFIYPPYEVAIVGDDWHLKRKELDKYYLPNTLLMGGQKVGKLPLLENKLIKGRTTIYVCKNKVCMFPVTDVGKALEQIK